MLSPIRAARFVVALMFLGLVGCASGPAPVSGSAPEASRPSAGTATTPVTPSPPRSPAPGAVDRLLSDAEEACAAGDLASGLARLDRALRIAPAEAGLYLQMARCHSLSGDTDRAAAAAERGLSYCHGRECRELRAYLGG